MNSVSISRDIRFDVLKGIATLLVVFGHVLQYSILGYEDSLFYNIVWSIQIPWFMVVSGYFSISRGLPSVKKLGIKLFGYLWPCITYYLVVSIVYHYNNPLKTAFNLIYHLEGTLWYLVVLSFLSIFNFIAAFLIKNILSRLWSVILYSVIFFSLIVLFAIPGLKLGFTFLGIKYVLYYSIFYWLGHLWHCISKLNLSGINKLMDISFAIMSLIYFYIIVNVNLYRTEDTLIGIIPRFIASVCGIYIVCFCIMKSKTSGRIKSLLSVVGLNSLELYYIHKILLRSLTIQEIEIISLKGFLTLFANFVFVLLSSYLIILIIKSSEFLYSIIFGSKLKK